MEKSREDAVELKLNVILISYFITTLLSLTLLLLLSFSIIFHKTIRANPIFNTLLDYIPQYLLTLLFSNIVNIGSLLLLLYMLIELRNTYLKYDDSRRKNTILWCLAVLLFYPIILYLSLIHI